MVKRKNIFRTGRYLTENEKAELEQIRYNKNREKATRILREEKFSTSKTGRTGEFLKSFARFSQIPQGYTKSIRTQGKRGRPKASYDKRYAAYGGVHGYRRQLTLRLQQQRLENYRRLAVNPQQQAILSQIEARERARQTSPENQIIPDTNGRVPLRSINDEINDAANLVP